MKLGGQGGEVDDSAYVANGEEQAIPIIGGTNKTRLQSFLSFV